MNWGTLFTLLPTLFVFIVVVFASVDFKVLGLISHADMYFRNQRNKGKLFVLFLLDCTDILIILWRIEGEVMVPAQDPQMGKFLCHDIQDSKSFIYGAYFICMQFSETSLSTLASSSKSPRTFSAYIQRQYAF